MNLTVVGRNLDIDPTQRALIEDAFGSALDRFAYDVDRVEVVMSDVNGPKGGVDHHCRVLVNGPEIGQLVASSVGENVVHAARRAAKRVSAQLRRVVDRRVVRSANGAPRSDDADAGTDNFVVPV